MRQGFSITPQLSCVHDHARLRKNLVGHWRTGYGRMTATLTFEPQKIQKLLKTYDLYWFILSSMIKTFEWNKKQSALSWEKWSHPCQCFLGCRINIKEKTLKKCSWPFHWKTCTCFQVLLTIPLQRTCANGRWLRSPWNLEPCLNLN